FGDMFTLRLAYEGTWVVTADPAVIKQVFTGDPRVLHAGEANRILRPVLGPNSVLLLDDDEHMRQRKLMLPPFHGERMLSYGEMMAQIASEEIERWPLGKPYRLRPRMQALTLEVILRAVFGVSEGPRMDRMREALRRLVGALTTPLAGAFLVALGPVRIGTLGLFQRELERVNRPIYEEIALRRGAADLDERDDIMSLLLRATHEDGSPMSDEELRDELITLLVAGHETTANALAWAAERLCRHPEKLARLRDEARAGESEEYLDAVVHETLRLRPVISVVGRRLKEPMELGGWELPAGVGIVPAIHLVHRRPDVYPEPDEFRPERFLESPPGTYTWIPFGGGVRRCLGASFAQFEMKVVLRELVDRCELLPARPRSERVYRRAITETPRHDAEVLVLRAKRGTAATGEQSSAAQMRARAA
ncbi:MAG: cytochrome P450, partial [Acidobacteriota bacterium]|nr:cytochrome P450 [Acidobacteriota bacterium]